MPFDGCNRERDDGTRECEGNGGNENADRDINDGIDIDWHVLCWAPSGSSSLILLNELMILIRNQRGQVLSCYPARVSAPS